MSERNEKKYELRKQIRSVRWIIFWVILAQFTAQMVVEAVVSFMPNPPHEYIRIAVVELFAIGIPNIGKKTARDLMEHFGSLNALMNAGEEELIALCESMQGKVK